ncbi:Uncharacterized protein Rs2_32224 [Raphanus sativus]|nr:Uncharacterized protein Rs2_32224 [Raphanus sativus]
MMRFLNRTGTGWWSSLRLQKRTSEVLKEKFSTFGWESSQRSPEASPLYPRNISPAFDETEATIFSFFGTKITSQGVKGQASDKRLPEFLEKKGDYSFGREDEDLVLSDPSSDEKDSDGSIEDSPALGHYNSSMGRAVALFPVALQNFEKKLKSAAKNKSEETHLELGNVKSHIITEPEKTSNEKIMRMIHEKFEDDDVGNHLADFKSAIGGLEANQQRTSHQKLSAHFEGGIHTKLNNSVSKICKRTFSSSPPYKPVKPEIPTHIKPEDFSDVHGFVMKLQQYHSDYNITNMNNELKEKAYQLKLQEEYSAKAQAARDRNDTAGAEDEEDG